MTLPKKNMLLIILVCLFATIPLLNFVLTKAFLSPTSIDVLEMLNYPVILQTYREPNLINDNTPSGSPLGGRGYENTTVTAYYQDQLYKQNFGYDHWGVDLIPSENYYKNSWVYLNTGNMVFFSTHGGRAEYFVDQYGANYLQITNQDQTIRTHYVHMQASYIRTGQMVDPGQAIGLVGQTGNATGVHLHYSVQIKDAKGRWIYANPQPYIVR